MIELKREKNKAEKWDMEYYRKSVEMANSLARENK